MTEHTEKKEHAMPDINDATERLIADPAFKAELARDPEAALAGYQLTADDRGLLAKRVSPDDGGQGVVEQRTSKAGLVGVLSQFADGLGTRGGAPGAEVSIQDAGNDRSGAVSVDNPDLYQRGGTPGAEVSIQDAGTD